MKELTGAERRNIFLKMLKDSDLPVSGTVLGRKTGVSRQVVVHDMALLRMQGHQIMSTSRGYVVEDDGQHEAVRLVKVCHTDEQVEEELNLIVDFGGTVLDVMVNHRVYGKVTAPLSIRSRRDVKKYVEDIKSGKSSPLLNVTSGYHFHNIKAENEDVLDEIENELAKKDFLADFLSYEVAAE